MQEKGYRSRFCVSKTPKRMSGFNLRVTHNQSIDTGVFPNEWKNARITPLFKVAYYSFRTMRALIYARAAQGTRKHHACAKSREPAEEISRAEKQNGGSRKNFLVFQVGFRGVLTVARLCLGLITEKTCCLMVAVP